MLDFYRINDEIEDYALLAEGNYLGSLSLEQHKQIQRVFQRPQSIVVHPFDDTRLRSHEVRQLITACQECLSKADNRGAGSPYQMFLHILEQAAASGAGFVAFCD